jgi:hypothetical protein
MRKVYAKSIIEGAPLGNKNATGPHHGRSKMVGVWGGGKNVTFDRTAKVPKRTITTKTGQSRTYPSKKIFWRKTFNNVTPSSQRRFAHATRDVIMTDNGIKHIKTRRLNYDD